MMPLEKHRGPKDEAWLLACVSPEPNSGCWIWLGALDTKGYAKTGIGGRTVAVHRLAFEIQRGRIPAGMELDHLCRVRCCVNPQHMEPVDHRTNLLRGATFAARFAAATHCPSGHPYSGENLRRIGERGYRACRACNRIAARAHRRRASQGEFA